MASVGQHHGHHLFGHRVRIRARRIHHVHALLPGVLDVDRVIPRSRAYHDLELRQRVYDRCGNFFAADDHRIGVGMGLDQLRRAQVQA